MRGCGFESGAYVKLPARNSAAGNQSALPALVDEERRKQNRSDPLEIELEQAYALLSREEEGMYALTLLRDRHPELLAPRLQSEADGGRPWLEQTCGILSMASTRQGDCENVAGYLGLTKDEAASIVDRATEVCALKSSGSDKHLHKITNVGEPDESVMDLVSPTIPLIAALKLAGEFAPKIGKFSEKNEDAPALLDHFCRNVQPDPAGLVFHLSESCPPDGQNLALRYRRLLTGLGISEADLWFEACDGTCSKFPRGGWYRSWELRPRPTCRIINRHGKRHRQSRQASGCRSR